jgi:superfamily I DNA and/or RNA helicase
MSNAIMGFSNFYFYENKLVADETVESNSLVNDENSSLFQSLEFIDTAGCSYEEIQNPETLSYSNPKEGDLVFQHLQQLLKEYSLLENYPTINIGIIAPYKEQIEWLKENQSSYALQSEKLSSLSIKTIDGFQGEERDVIYLCLVAPLQHAAVGQR